MTDIDWEAERAQVRRDIEARAEAERQRCRAYCELWERSLAVHEAAHSVIGMAHGIATIDVALKTASGLCRWAPGTPFGIPAAHALAAGDLAATRLGFAIGADHRAVGIDSDRAQIVKCLAGFDEPAIAAVIAITKEDVRARWDAICSVADALVATRILTGEQVEAILAADNTGAAERYEARCRDLQKQL